MRSMMLAIISTITIAAATNATAGGYSFSPAAARFTASGTAYVAYPWGSVGVTCSVSVKGKVTRKGEALVEAVTFSGGDACNGMAAGDYPWWIKAHTATGGKSHNISISGLFNGGRCGPDVVPMTANQSGAWVIVTETYTDCSMRFELATSPAISIVATP